MENEMQIFENKEFGKIHIVEIDDSPWFISKEIAAVLGYRNGRDALRVHVDSEDKADVVIHDGRQKRKMTVINESGLYCLVLSSKLPEAKRFKRWLTSEVLPSIRMHGAYVIGEILDAAEKNRQSTMDLLNDLLDERAKNASLLCQMGTNEPKAVYCDLVLQSKNVIPASLIAKEYGMSVVSFNTLLHNLRIQYKLGGTWVLYQAYADKGYTKTRTYCIGEEIATMRTYWTQKGRMFLYETLKKYGIMPQMEDERMSVDS